MLNINEVTICGCLGRDPDLRYGANNLAFVTLPVATNRRVKGADGNYQSVTDWNNVVAFGKTAETISEYMRKGSPISCARPPADPQIPRQARRRTMGNRSGLRELPVRPKREGSSTTTGRTIPSSTRTRTYPDL